MKISKELKIGFFVVVIAVTAFFLINFLRGKDIFNREMYVMSAFGKVEGLLPSAPVYIDGYKAGSVTDITYEPDSGLFYVCCSVQKQFRIPEDSRMTIYGVDIMGGKGVRIDRGVSSVMIEDGDFIEPCLEPDLLTALSASAVPLLKGLSATVDSLNVTVSRVNNILSDENSASVRRTLAHLENTVADVERISTAVGGRSEELSGLIASLSSFSCKLDSLAFKAGNVLDGTSDFVQELESADISGMAASFRDLLESIKNPDGSIGKLLDDGSVYESVDSLLKDIDSLVKKIEKNPKKYIRISIF